MAFKPGHPGNPRGRPKGRSDRRTRLRQVFEQRATELIDKAIELALAGDTRALRLCLERVCPPLEGQLLSVPALADPQGTLPEQAQAVTTAVGRGELDLAAAGQLLSLLERKGKIAELSELAQQLDELQAMVAELQASTAPSNPDTHNR